MRFFVVSLFLLIFCFSESLIAQEKPSVKVTLGGEFKIKGASKEQYSVVPAKDLKQGNNKKDYFPMALGAGGSDLLVMSRIMGGVSSKSALYMAKLDARLNPKEPIENRLKEKGLMLTAKFCFQWAGKTSCLISGHNQWKGKKQIFLKGIDDQSLLLEEGKTVLAEYDCSPMENLKFDNYTYRISNDDSKLVLAYEMPTSKQGFRQYGIHVLDKNFEVIWSKEFEIPYKKGIGSLEQVEIDNQGNAFLLIRKYRTKNVVISDRDFDYELVGLFEKGERFEPLSLDIQGLPICGGKMSFDNEQNLICAGLISSKKSAEAEGVFYVKLKVADRLEVLVEKHQMLSKEISVFKFQEMLIDENGDAYVLAEHYYAEVRFDNNGQQMDDAKYTFDDILVMKVNNRGELLWDEIVEKKQRMEEPAYGSFGAFIFDSNLHLLFSEQVKNMQLGVTDKRLKSGDGDSNLVLVSIEGADKVSKQKLLESEEEDFWAHPAHTVNFADGEYLVPGRDGSKVRYVKVAFQ